MAHGNKERVHSLRSSLQTSSGLAKVTVSLEVGRGSERQRIWIGTGNLFDIIYFAKGPYE